MIKQKSSYWWFKLNGALRYILAHTSTRYFPLYIVNEYPKSGASWIGEMLSDALDVPFPRNRLPMFKSSILHGHMWHNWNMNNVLCVWRDGRDVLISQYYHYLFENEKGNKSLVEKCRGDLKFTNYDDIRNNLPAFMDYVYQENKHPHFSWSEFVSHWFLEERYVHVKYEDMRLNPVKTLGSAIVDLTGNQLNQDILIEIIENHSFAKVSGRTAGEENKKSFLRKGIIGDWKNHFNQTAKARFSHYAGDALIKLGYENNDHWVQ